MDDDDNDNEDNNDEDLDHDDDDDNDDNKDEDLDDDDDDDDDDDGDTDKDGNCSQVDRNNHDGCHNVNLHKYNYMCVMLCSPPVWYPGLYPPSPSVYLILIPPFPDIEKLSEPVKAESSLSRRNLARLEIYPR